MKIKKNTCLTKDNLLKDHSEDGLVKKILNMFNFWINMSRAFNRKESEEQVKYSKDFPTL